MSRIGNEPIVLPQGVTVEVDGSTLKVKGSKGELALEMTSHITAKVVDGLVSFARDTDEKVARAEHGLMRSLTKNMVIGVSEGFKKQLEVNGVGFKSSVSGQNLKLSLGYSHEITFKVPEDIEVAVDNNVISLSGIDKQKVGQTAAEIRKLRKPEPYKGKGIKYVDEYIVRKAGKAAGGAE